MVESYPRTDALLARSNGQTLAGHTDEVVKYALQIYGDGPLVQALRIAAAVHDLGKAQKTYQELYRTNRRAGTREHALAGAWIVRFLRGLPRAVVCVAGRLVESHHKGLERSSDTEVASAVDDAVEALQEILRRADPVLEVLERNGIPREALAHVQRLLSDLRQRMGANQVGVLELIQSQLQYPSDDVGILLWIRRALGALVVADSLSAASLPPRVILELPRRDVRPQRIHEFLSGVRKGRLIDSVRARIGEMVERFARSVDLNRRILTVALPTGAGKTLHSLRLATILRERISKELGQEPPRILYVMPFTTIIDQAYDVFRKIYGDAVQRRHYLVDERPHPDAPEEIAAIYDLLYPEEITVTTYVQLYLALVGNGRRDAIRSLALRNRIIILDEVQAVPHEHWGLMRELLRELARDNWLILMSATVPRYVVPEGAVSVIEPGAVPRRDVFRRHIFRLKMYPDYADVVSDAVERYLSGESVAIVVNTVRTAEVLYQMTKDALASRGVSLTPTVSGSCHEGGCVVYLSTYVPPFARRARIHRFSGHVLAITTQVIEAGVDVSVDVLYRELAPVDSIVQAAGRCNRNGERRYGDVIVFETPYTRDAFERVYGKALLAATDAALKEVDSDVFGDEELEGVLEEYFHNALRDEKSGEVLKKARASVRACDFSLDVRAIREVPKIPVVVLYPGAKLILNELRGEYTRTKKDRVRIATLFRKLGAYIVNVYPQQADRFDEIPDLASRGVYLYSVRPDDADKYIEDVGVLYSPRGAANTLEERLA